MNKGLNKETQSWPADSRKCRICGNVKKLTEFHKFKRGAKGRYPICKLCRKPIVSIQQKARSIELKLWTGAKNRAKKKELEFTLKLEDIVIPAKCIVFNVPLVCGTEYAPSIDRIDSRKGYTPDNIRVISKRANLLKSDASVEEMEMILKDLKTLRLRGQATAVTT